MHANDIGPRPRLSCLRTGSALAVLVLAAGPAAAQAGGPPLMPSRDVTVLYGVRPDGAPQEQAVRVYFRGGGGLMRIDGPPAPDGSSTGDMIMDRDGHMMTVVMNQPRIYMQIPERDEVHSPFVLNASMQFTRTGTGMVAGLACTTWAITTPKGPANACVTADGVVLSEAGVDGEGAKGELMARTVQYGPLPASLFAPPAGYQRTAHPEGLGRGLGGGAAGTGSGDAGPGGLDAGQNGGAPSGPLPLPGQAGAPGQP